MSRSEVIVVVVAISVAMFGLCCVGGLARKSVPLVFTGLLYGIIVASIGCAFKEWGDP